MLLIQHHDLVHRMTRGEFSIEAIREVIDELNNASAEKIWGERRQIINLFMAKTGIILRKNDSHSVLTIDFMDRVNISRKMSHMATITDIEQLKNYLPYIFIEISKKFY